MLFYKNFIALHISLFRVPIAIAIGGVLFLLIFLSSCKKPSAQYPSNKIDRIDSTEVFLKDYNQEIIQKEDSAILVLVSAQSIQFKKSSSGIWYFTQKSTLNPLLTNDSVATISYKMYSLRGELLYEEENLEVQFEKKEVISGLEEALKLMHKGETARFIIPSYLAFGAEGTDLIPPYTPVVCLIESL